MMKKENDMNEYNLELDPEFRKESMYMQLGRIVDSESARSVVPAKKFNPVEHVITEEGTKFKVSAKEAQFMREMIVKVPTVPRADLLKKIQTKNGFKEFKEAIKQFMKGMK
jgi:hypothetical protein